MLSHEPIYGLSWCLNIHGHDHNNMEAYREGCKHINLAANVCDFTPVNLGKLIKDGILADIDGIHRVTIDRASERKEKERQSNMWKDHKQLNRISESIAGWHIGKYINAPYYIRYNPATDVANSIEYTLEAPHEQMYPEDLFQTTADKIERFDDGEFGGYLAIGGKKVCDGNFSQIFEYCGEKYVIDSLWHMCSGTFRLIRVNDDGTIEVIYDSDKYRKLRTELLSKMKLENRKDGIPTAAEREQYELNKISQVGLEGYYIGNDLEGNEAVYFLCSGELIDLDKSGRERYQSVKYLLVFDKFNENAPLVRIDMPAEKIDFCDVTSIWTDGLMLSTGRQPSSLSNFV